MWRQSETPILKRARITRENLVALSKPFARIGGSLGENEGNWTTRKAVNSGSSLQTNPVHVSLGVTGSRRRAEPRMRNLVFSSQHGGSILIEALERIGSDAGAFDDPECRPIESRHAPTSSCTPRPRSEE